MDMSFLRRLNIPGLYPPGVDAKSMHNLSVN